MEQVGQFVVQHAGEVIEVFAAFFLVIVGVISLTPRKDDDDALRGFINSLSPMQRKVLGGGALAAVLGLAATLLGGCAHRQAIRAFVKGASCATCAALDGQAGCEAEE